MAAAALLVAGCTTTSATPVDATAAPTDAAPGPFCAQWRVMVGLQPDDVDGGRVEEVRAAARELARIGTPGDIPRSAREGFVRYVAALSVLTEEQARDGAAAPLGDVTAALGLAVSDGGDLAAVRDYGAGTCFS